jgi:cation diffusion facilitator family transporter
MRHWACSRNIFSIERSSAASDFSNRLRPRALTGAAGLATAAGERPIVQDIKLKQRVALSSIAASAGLTLAKAAVGLATGSLAILSEAAHSLLDMAATVMTYFAVRISGKPADEEHHYGHGKIESVTALAETALLFLLSGIVIWEAVQRLYGGHGHVEATAWAFAVMIASVVIDFFRARTLYRVAAQTSSEALEADALHFGSDMWSSCAVLAGLAAVALGYPWADSAAAIVVAAFICVAGWRLARRTVDTLTDTAPAGAALKIAAAVERIAGVVAIERLRVRQVGHVLFADLVVAVSRTLPFERVAKLKDRIVEAVRSSGSGAAEVTVTTEPRALDDETVLERIMVIARNRALAVHHVTVHRIADRLAVSLDLEVNAALSLGAAHEIASGLEQAVAEELGPGVEVETHIEPMQPHDEPGREAGPERVAEVRAALTEIAEAIALVGEVHDVRVRDAEGGEIVNFHCHVNAAIKVGVVHEKVDEIERALRLRFPSIMRVIGHAEPAPLLG